MIEEGKFKIKKRYYLLIIIAIILPIAYIIFLEIKEIKNLSEWCWFILLGLSFADTFIFGCEDVKEYKKETLLFRILFTLISIFVVVIYSVKVFSLIETLFFLIFYFIKITVPNILGIIIKRNRIHTTILLKNIMFVFIITILSIGLIIYLNNYYF